MLGFSGIELLSVSIQFRQPDTHGGRDRVKLSEASQIYCSKPVRSTQDLSTQKSPKPGSKPQYGALRQRESCRGANGQKYQVVKIAASKQRQKNSSSKQSNPSTGRGSRGWGQAAVLVTVADARSHSATARWACMARTSNSGCDHSSESGFGDQPDRRRFNGCGAAASVDLHQSSPGIIFMLSRYRIARGSHGCCKSRYPPSSS